MKPPRIALVYDRVNTRFGGAENVLLALHEIFPQAPLYTSVYNPETAPWASVFTVIPSFLQKFPFAKTHHRIFAALMPLAFESFDFSQFDIVISITSAEAKGVLTKPNQKHICYLLTPTRYLWSHAEEYQTDPLTGWLRRVVFKYLKWWDEAAALRPDVLIPISKLVAERCQEYYHRETAPVIYPTVSQPADIAIPEISQKDFYLIVSRLVPYKRIDLAIEVCQKLGRNLVIIGQGPDLERLQNLAENLAKTANATSKVTFLQAVHPDEIVAYYRHCRAFLAPAEEDFGMTVIEAQQQGRPVIVYAKSGGAELVEEGVSGIHFFEQSDAGLREAIHIFESRTWESAQIQKSVAEYTRQHFIKEFRAAVQREWPL